MLQKNVIPKIIIIAGFLISINLYWVIIGGPICLIGILYFLFQKRPVISKVIWTLWPPLLVYPAFVVFLYISGAIGTAVAQKLEFRFPHNFRGTSVIISNMHCGQGFIIKNDREVLNIPENGILFYKGDIEHGYINHIYTTYNEKGELIELPELHIQDFNNSEPNPDSTKLGVFYSCRPIMSQELPQDSHKLSYTLSTYKEIDQYHEFQYGRKLDELIDSLVINCKN